MRAWVKVSALSVMMRSIWRRSLLGRQLVKAHGLLDGPEQPVGVEHVEEKTVARAGAGVQVRDGVVQAAGVVHHRQRAVDGGDHLRQAAGLEPRGHEDEIRRGVGQVLQLLVEVADRHPLVELVVVDDVLKYSLVVAVGHEDDLQVPVPAAGDDLVEDVRQQLAALLHRVQARGPEEERRPDVFDQPEVALQEALVFALAGGVVLGP